MADLKELYRKGISDQIHEGDALEAKDIEGSNLYKLFLSFAELFNILHCRTDELLLEYFPSTSTELADKWADEMYNEGVSDCLKDLPIENQQAVRALIADSFANGGNTVEYFEQISEKMGFSMTMLQNTPTIFEAELYLDVLDGIDDPFTKPISGSGQTLIIPPVPQTLAELGVTIDPDTRAIEITILGNPSDYLQLVRYREDGSAPTAEQGHPMISGQTFRFTQEQYQLLELVNISSSGQTFATIVQYGKEDRYLTTQSLCGFDPCGRLVNHDLQTELNSLKCLLLAVMPAHLIFNLFVNGKLYDIVKPINL